MSGEPTLHHGHHEAVEWVTYMQSLLSYHGHSVAADGVFGAATLAAVRAFQKEQHLQVDGVVGEHTWAALRGETAPAAHGGAAEGAHGGAAESAHGATHGGQGHAGPGHAAGHATGHATWGYGEWLPRYDGHDDTVELFATNTGHGEIHHGRYHAQVVVTGEHGHEIHLSAPLNPVYDEAAKPQDGLRVLVDQVVARVGHGVLTVAATMPAELGSAAEQFQIAAAFDAATDTAEMPHNHHAVWADHSAGASIDEGRGHSVDLMCIAGGVDPIQGGVYSADVTFTSDTGQSHHARIWVGEEAETYHPGDTIHVLAGNPMRDLGSGRFAIAAVLPAELGGGYLETHVTV